MNLDSNGWDMDSPWWQLRADGYADAVDYIEALERALAHFVRPISPEIIAYLASLPPGATFAEISAALKP